VHLTLGSFYSEKGALPEGRGGNSRPRASPVASRIHDAAPAWRTFYLSARAPRREQRRLLAEITAKAPEVPAGPGAGLGRDRSRRWAAGRPRRTALDPVFKKNPGGRRRPSSARTRASRAARLRRGPFQEFPNGRQDGTAVLPWLANQLGLGPLLQARRMRQPGQGPELEGKPSLSPPTFVEPVAWRWPGFKRAVRGRTRPAIEDLEAAPQGREPKADRRLSPAECRPTWPRASPLRPPKVRPVGFIRGGTAKIPRGTGSPGAQPSRAQGKKRTEARPSNFEKCAPLALAPKLTLTPSTIFVAPGAGRESKSMI